MYVRWIKAYHICMSGISSYGVLIFLCLCVYLCGSATSHKILKSKSIRNHKSWNSISEFISTLTLLLDIMRQLCGKHRNCWLWTFLFIFRNMCTWIEHVCVCVYRLDTIVWMVNVYKNCTLNNQIEDIIFETRHWINDCQVHYKINNTKKKNVAEAKNWCVTTSNCWTSESQNHQT